MKMQKKLHTEPKSLPKKIRDFSMFGWTVKKANGETSSYKNLDFYSLCLVNFVRFKELSSAQFVFSVAR